MSHHPNYPNPNPYPPQSTPPPAPPPPPTPPSRIVLMGILFTTMMGGFRTANLNQITAEGLLKAWIVAAVIGLTWTVAMFAVLRALGK